MDAYTLHLLGMAVEACDHRGATLTVSPPAEWVPIWGVSVHHRIPANGPELYEEGPTLADALAALLRDLGVEVPERPDGRVIDAHLHAEDRPTPFLRQLYRDEPLAVLALLEERS